MKGLKNLWKLTNGGIFAIVISNCYYCLLICYSTLVKLFNFFIIFFFCCATIIWWIKMYNWMLLLYRPIEGPCVCVMEGRRKEEAGSCVVSGWDYFSHSGCWHEALACGQSCLAIGWPSLIQSLLRPTPAAADQIPPLPLTSPRPRLRLVSYTHVRINACNYCRETYRQIIRLWHVSDCESWYRFWNFGAILKITETLVYDGFTVYTR